MRNADFMDEDHEERINRIVREYGDAILRLCCLYLRNRATAEDAAQDSLIKIDRRLESFRGECSEKTWIMRIVTNTCRDYAKTAWMRHVDKSVVLEDWLESVSPQTDPREVHERNLEVLRAVMQLKAPLRETVLLRYYQEMTVSEVAQALHISVSAVNKRLRKAQSQLKPELWEVYFND